MLEVHYFLRILFGMISASEMTNSRYVCIQCNSGCTALPGLWTAISHASKSTILGAHTKEAKESHKTGLGSLHMGEDKCVSG